MRTAAAAESSTNLLTPRQLEVLELMAKGLTNREIAGVLGVSQATVKTHVAAVIAALEVTNRTEAATRLHELALGAAGETSQGAFHVDGFGSRPAIAVLPFDTFSSDPEQNLLADGFVEDLITRLAGWRWFPVISRNSSFAYARASSNVKRASEELGARYVIEGSIRPSSDGLRITVQLIDGPSDTHLLAERYDVSRSSIFDFDFQDEVVDTLVATIEPALMQLEGVRVSARRPGQLDAWECVRRGFALCHENTIDGWERSKGYFERAAEIDPTLSTAHSFRAWATLQLALWGQIPAEAAFDELRASAERAHALDPHDPVSHNVLGWSATAAGRTHDALAHFERSIELDPSFAWSHAAKGQCYVAAGKPEEGLAAVGRAIRLSPKDIQLNFFLLIRGLALATLGRMEEAEAELRRSIRAAPESPHGYLLLAVVLVVRDKIDEARTHVSRVKELAEGLSVRAMGHMLGPVEPAIALLGRAGWVEPDR